MNMTQEKIDRIMIDELDGYIINRVEGPNDSEIQFWAVNGETVVVQNFGEDVGFQVYCSSGRFSVLDTIEFVKQQVGL